MPELPEVEALTHGLADRLVGGRIDACELASFSALKTFDPPISDLVGRRVAGVERRGKFVCFDTGDLWLVVHLALGGWITWYDAVPPTRPKPGRSKIALRVRIDRGSGFDVTEMGTEKRLALWVASSPEAVEPLAALGIDPLGVGFTAEHLGSLLAQAPSTLKVALTTQSLIAGVGNAYSDEALHRAKLSPFKRADRLDASEVERVRSAVVGVLSEAVGRSSVVDLGELKGDKKRSMQVHGRTGSPCPVCGDTVRQVAYTNRSLQYCPTCQTGGKVLADRRLSRLLK